MNNTRNIAEHTNVVNLKSHQFKKAIHCFVDGLNGVLEAESDFFAKGKFRPFAESYIESGFNSEFCPQLSVEVNFRDYVPKGEAKEFLAFLRRAGFEVSHIKFAKGYAPKSNPDGRAFGPIVSRVLSYSEGKEIFNRRDASPYGAYQPSQAGFRSTFITNWDDRGIGFHLRLGGQDNRRADKYRNPTTYENHIIDNEKDMQEVSDMYAMVNRARIRAV